MGTYYGTQGKPGIQDDFVEVGLFHYLCDMKRIIIMAVAALLFAAPVVLAQNPEKTKTEKTSKSDENICTITFATDMHCESCVTKINENIAFEKGVKDLKVSLEEERITIKYDKRKTSEEILAASVRKLGYKAEKVN